MGETAVIARMAEKLADEILAEFFWRKSGPMNVNWDCENPEVHGVKKHPTDTVFFYDEPYSEARRYLQCDLKSYGKTSITRPQMKAAIVSLAKQVTCAEISSDWQRMYVDDQTTPVISGLLFVYNHDDEYDADFDHLLSDIRSEDLQLNPDSRLFIFGPDDINWLDRVATEIRQMRGKGDLPSRQFTSFYYPQLVRKSNFQIVEARAATAEMLSSPWIMLRWEDDETRREGFVVFHRRKTTVDDLVYLLDYLRHFQLLQRKIDVTIKVSQTDSDATIILQKAVRKYIDHISGQNEDSDIGKFLQQVKIGFVPENKTSFSTDAIGMEYVER
ncbi:hypothetical protein [Rhizobium binae]|uniref:hypothetical protein n=1 Tax=Rhizobium binae TaxID=1138190 RepID=UPI001C832FDA|nr:hypothetical protein [Rhizobium binae]MBX4961370.1 hypothetical protein [Rhizobium binae]